MKEHHKLIAAGLLAPALLWLSISLSLWNLNIGTWDPLVRVIFVLCSWLSWLIILLAYLNTDR